MVSKQLNNFKIGLILTCCLLPCLINSKDIILEPADKSQKEICAIFAQGAQIPPEQYVPLMTQLQKDLSSYSAWIAIPEFILDLSNPLQFTSKVNSVKSQMQSQGMQSQKCFILAHSLGGVMTQLYASGNPDDVLGLVLTGSFILRQYRQLGKNGLHSIKFPMPILTIGGDVDGLARVTRITESYMVQQRNLDTQLNSTKDFPVVVLQGVNHMRFSSGTPPLLVKERDLKAELTEDEAHKMISQTMKTFILQVLGDSLTYNLRIAQGIQGQVSDAFFDPIVESFHLEGTYNFKPACFDSDLINAEDPQCTKGSPWVEKAQGMMAGFDNITYDVNDNSHRVYSVTPIHLPIINNECKVPGCELKVTTVSQSIYETLDAADSGFTYVTASEIKAKMMSRQSLQQKANNPEANFNDTDTNERCKEINQKALEWALNQAGKVQLDRYQKYGEPFVMGTDNGPYNAGPLWIWTYIGYNEKQDDQKNYYTEVNSAYMSTPTDYFIKSAAGFHYCKLLSPARALEWIYVDSLRRNYHIDA